MRSRTCFVLALAASAFACSVQAGVVTGSPVPVFKTLDNSRDIALTPGSPVFSADLSTYANCTSQMHDILGAMPSPNYPGWADVEHQAAPGPDLQHGDIPLPYMMVGRGADGSYGHLIWKFVLPAGYETGSGAKIDASVYFRHDPATSHGTNALLGVMDSITYYSDDSGPSNYPPSVVKTAQDIFAPGTGYATYNGSTSLSIPAGKSEFFVIFSDQGSSARWALTAFSVTGDPVPVPEPLGAGAIGAAILLLRRRRLV